MKPIDKFSSTLIQLLDRQQTKIQITDYLSQKGTPFDLVFWDQATTVLSSELEALLTFPKDEEFREKFFSRLRKLPIAMEETPSSPTPIAEKTGPEGGKQKNVNHGHLHAERDLQVGDRTTNFSGVNIINNGPIGSQKIYKK